jgi:thiamine biosynthesis lipoprotein
MNAPLDQHWLRQVGEVEQIRARPLLGTLVEITASGIFPDKVQSAIDCAFDEVERVHALMSYHAADSDVSRINREAFDHPVQVDEHTMRVLTAAYEMSEASSGQFDITVAPTLTKLGFLPRRPDLPRISGQGDWRHVNLLDGNRVRLTRRLRIDLSGIAKGYAVDLAIQALASCDMTAGKVNAGGDMRLNSQIHGISLGDAGTVDAQPAG